jgi:multiple sugar transport system ATP-binding protein
MNLLERSGLLVGFRPEHVRGADGPPSPGAARFRFHCELTEYLGSERLAFGTLEGDASGQEIAWRFPAWEAGPAPGSACEVAIERSRLRFFDPASGRRVSPPREIP